MVIKTLVSLCFIGALASAGIVLAEILRHKRLIGNEDARKAVHILHAVGIAGWAYFLPNYLPIIIIELLFITSVMITKKYNTFGGMRAVGRLTHGELLFPLGIISLCLLEPRYSWFILCVLQLGLSDAAAAVVGKRVRSFSYMVFNHRKSVAGSAAFFVSSLILFGGYIAAQPSFAVVDYLPVIMLGSISLVCVENLSPYGSDNITIPLAVYAMLTAGMFS